MRHGLWGAMVYIAATGLPRLDLILNGADNGGDNAPRGAFAFSADDFFANAFDASTAGQKSGTQLTAAEADERRKEEEQESDAFRDSMAELAYLQEQIALGGVTLTVAEHGKLGKRLTSDPTFRAGVIARMKQDDPTLTDTAANRAIDTYAEWAKLKNIPPGQRTDAENERLRELDAEVKSNPTVGAVAKTASDLSIELQTPNEAATQAYTGKWTNSAEMAAVSDARTDLIASADSTASQSSGSATTFADDTEARPDRATARPAFGSAATGAAAATQDASALLSAADEAARTRAASFSI
ncbi:hypothetical protein KRZ98_05285 [Sphingobium sp. AS12]|uniref:hypothetical protein n=1 Tax=Sphingobium sp. AS12 TaxID=2849495 RepID=UPI001C312D66|nr:hypothetical protein [Sphingobium sp. AS12]MBV2147699.1 hypothetical protein [Sphingobium sp. AS12]